MIAKKHFLALLIICINLSNVRPQVCTYDSTSYSTDTSVAVSKTDAGTCQESYVVPSSLTTGVWLYFSNIVISCAGNANDLTLVDSSNVQTKYCTSYSGKTEFVDMRVGQSYIALQRKGAVSYNMAVKFSSTANACSFSQCLNGGTCTVTGTTTFSCTCASGYSGTTCQTKNVPNVVCTFDNQYTTDQAAVAINNNNPCTESYAVNSVLTNDIVVTFSSIVIDCTNSNNNIQIVDSSNNVYTYCNNNTGNSFSYTASMKNYVAIQRYGTVTGSLRIQFISNSLNACASSPCLNGGTCTNSGTSFTCACASGFSGTTCNTAVPVVPQVVCTYDSAYQMSTTVAINNNNPCTESYALSSGLTGDIKITFSSIVIDCTNTANNIKVIDSSSNSYSYCGNNSGNSFEFIGTKQQYVAVQRYGTVTGSLKIEILSDNSCSSSPCLNGGTCTNSGTSFTCACAAGFIGTTCATTLPACTLDNQYTTNQAAIAINNNNPCTESYAVSTTLTNDILVEMSNIAVDCTNTANNIRAIDAASNSYSYCGNNSGNSFLFIGRQQQYVSVQRFGTVTGSLKISFVASPANACSGSPCLNGGTCTATGSTTYTCACASGFIGATCATALPACTFDQTYTTNQAAIAINNNNPCTESYAYSTDLTKTITTTFNSIVCDCTNTANNIRVIDSSLNAYTYCGNNTGNSFTFTGPNKQYVAVQRYGSVQGSLVISFS